MEFIKSQVLVTKENYNITIIIVVVIILVHMLPCLLEKNLYKTSLYFVQKLVICFVLLQGHTLVLTKRKKKKETVTLRIILKSSC